MLENIYKKKKKKIKITEKRKKLKKEIKKYRHVSVLSSFSKTYENIIEESTTPFVNTNLY